MSDGQVTGDQQVQLNYVIPNELDSLLERYCAQTLIPPTVLVRRLVTEFVDGTHDLGVVSEHPRGRRTSVTLPARLMVALEAKIEEEGHVTKAGVIGALLADYLPPRVVETETVKVEVNLPTDIFDFIHRTFGPGPAESLVVRALEDLVASRSKTELAKESM